MCLELIICFYCTLFSCLFNVLCIDIIIANIYKALPQEKGSSYDVQSLSTFPWGSSACFPKIKRKIRRSRFRFVTEIEFMRTRETFLCSFHFFLLLKSVQSPYTLFLCGFRCPICSSKCGVWTSSQKSEELSESCTNVLQANDYINQQLDAHQDHQAGKFHIGRSRAFNLEFYHSNATMALNAIFFWKL